MLRDEISWFLDWFKDDERINFVWYDLDSYEFHQEKYSTKEEALKKLEMAGHMDKEVGIFEFLVNRIDTQKLSDVTKDTVHGFSSDDTCPMLDMLNFKYNEDGIIVGLSDEAAGIPIKVLYCDLFDEKV